jgi:tRNA (guanine37-N1)-methyltransferase
MIFHILTIFPEAFTSFTQTSMIAKAIWNNLLKIHTYKLCDFSTKNFKHVDNKAYWMHGQVISPEPLSKALKHIKTQCKSPPVTVYMSPSWDLLQQEKVETLYKQHHKNEIIIICGHYEWIDQRIIDKYVDLEISIWEYVLTSWELAAQVFIDAFSSHIPKVLWNVQSLEEESFSTFFNRQKEHPVYTRPRVFEWLEVPETLTSGNHKKIELWKHTNIKK